MSFRPFCAGLSIETIEMKLSGGSLCESAFFLNNRLFSAFRDIEKGVKQLNSSKRLSRVLGSLGILFN
jgi:hypothetical protein